MNKPLIFILSLLLFGCDRSENVTMDTSPRFDYAAVEAYFTLIDSLRAKQTITSAAWDTFLSVEGNCLYLSENKIPAAFTDHLMEILQSVYRSGSIGVLYDADLLVQIRQRYQQNDSLYREHLGWIKEHEASVADSMVARTIQYLSSNQLTNDSFPNIYYHALDHDGSANSKGIFISIMAAYDNNTRRLANYEAHEFHHLQRPSLLQGVPIDTTDTGIVWALDAILNEGLADLVDKDVMLSEASNWWLKPLVDDYYNGRSPDVIAQPNQHIGEEAQGLHHDKQEYRDVLLGTVGHVPGYWMANTIAEGGRLNELITQADNPFAFVLLYNDVATTASTDYPLFDSTSVDYILSLANQYGVEPTSINR